MTANPRKTRFAYAMMVAFMALSTAALAAASASVGHDRGISVVDDTGSAYQITRDAG
jgi:hypothetical protein